MLNDSTPPEASRRRPAPSQGVALGLMTSLIALTLLLSTGHGCSLFEPQDGVSGSAPATGTEPKLIYGSEPGMLDESGTAVQDLPGSP